MAAGCSDRTCSTLANSLGLEVLLEVHNEEELNKSVVGKIDLIGVNNRNLQTFETSIETSKALSEKIPSEFVKVAESGISDPQVVADLMGYGFEGFLIGEHFMQYGEPQRACRNFIKNVKSLTDTVSA